MKVKGNFVFIDQDLSIVNSDNNEEKIYLSNERAAFLWNYISKKEATKEELLHALLDNFDISTVLALNDIDVFLKQLNESGILIL